MYITYSQYADYYLDFRVIMVVPSESACNYSRCQPKKSKNGVMATKAKQFDHWELTFWHTSLNQHLQSCPPSGPERALPMKIALSPIIKYRIPTTDRTPTTDSTPNSNCRTTISSSQTHHTQHRRPPTALPTPSVALTTRPTIKTTFQPTTAVCERRVGPM